MSQEPQCGMKDIYKSGYPDGAPRGLEKFVMFSLGWLVKVVMFSVVAWESYYVFRGDVA